MSAGDWYWIPRAVIQEFAAKTGFSAIAIYNVLASMADEDQRCFPSQTYIAGCLGCSRATVNRAIKILERHKLIAVERKNHDHNVYYLLAVECSKDGTQMSHGRNPDVQKDDTNNTNEQEINNNNVVSVKNSTSDFYPTKTREELLASDISVTLDDHRNFKTYLSYANKYPESFLRKILSETKLTPVHKIKKSRGALFMYLVKYYAHKNS
ncbi:MAG: helix-turn-helix domain-containing protein [Ignavibacteriaceae bacterium]